MEKDLKIHITRATIENYNEIQNLYFYGDQYHYDGNPKHFGIPKHQARSKELFVEQLNSPSCIFFVAKKDDMIIGVLHGYIEKKEKTFLMNSMKYALLESIIVEPKYQKKRVGTKLFEAFLNWVEQQDITSIQLSVFEFNTEILEWYKKLGFKTIFRKMEKNIK